MRNILLLFIVGALTTGGFSAHSQAKSATEARKEADSDLIHREAEIDSAAGFEPFKKIVQSQVLANDKNLALLKQKKYSRNSHATKVMAKKIVGLERRNQELSDRLSGYKTRISWASFKRQLMLDMNKLIDEIRVIS